MPAKAAPRGALGLFGLAHCVRFMLLAVPGQFKDRQKDVWGRSRHEVLCLIQSNRPHVTLGFWTLLCPSLGFTPSCTQGIVRAAHSVPVRSGCSRWISTSTPERRRVPARRYRDILASASRDLARLLKAPLVTIRRRFRVCGAPVQATTSGHQIPVLQRVGSHDPGQRVPEDVRVVTVVEAPLQFFKVAVQVLHADLVERADDGALEQASRRPRCCWCARRRRPTPRPSG